MSFSTQRARPQTRLDSVRSATVRTAWKSPSEMTGNPASMTSTPKASSCMAIRTFCSTVMAAPGHCSPSLSVVSKICMCFFITVKKVVRVHSFQTARAGSRFPGFARQRQSRPAVYFPRRRNGSPAHIKISSRTTVREAAIDDLEGTGCSSCLFLLLILPH